MTDYTPTHDAGDLGSLSIDVIVEAGIVLLQFITLVVLVLMFGWFKKNVR